jgi:hypothetical protein
MIAVKDGVVEMTATLADPHRDQAEAFAEAMAAKIYAHQYQAMTDGAILDPPNMGIASCLISRDPLAAPLKDALLSLGFVPIDTEAGGTEERSMFARFQKPRRTRLEKWRSMFLRANDVSPKLAALEEILIDELPEGPLSAISAEASNALINAARTSLRILLAPNFECIGQLERLIVQERASRKGRLVFHPAVVRAIAGFVAETMIHAAPRSRWSDEPDDESPLHVEAPRGGIVRTDPEFRTVQFVIKGAKEMLSSYIEGVLRQSLTAARQT